MKKLLVLSLVLSVASLATAGMSLSGDVSGLVGEDLTIQVLVTDEIPGGGVASTIWFGLNDAALDIVSAQVEPLAGSSAVMVDYSADWQYLNWPTSPLLGSYGDGVWATFVVEGLAEGTYSVQVQDNNYDTQDTATVTIVPEPMTMALLGLGGLLIRRKK